MAEDMKKPGATNPLDIKPSDKIKVSNGKLIQEIPVKQLENRKTNIEKRIAALQAQIISINEEITKLQAQATDLDGLIQQIA